MHGFNGVVRFGTKKTIGFLRLVAIFAITPVSDTSVDEGVELGAPLRIFGKIRC